MFIHSIFAHVYHIEPDYHNVKPYSHSVRSKSVIFRWTLWCSAKKSSSAIQSKVYQRMAGWDLQFGFDFLICLNLEFSNLGLAFELPVFVPWLFKKPFVFLGQARTETCRLPPFWSWAWAKWKNSSVCFVQNELFPQLGVFPMRKSKKLRRQFKPLLRSTQG